MQVLKFCTLVHTELSKDSTGLSPIVMSCVDITALLFVIWGLSMLDLSWHVREVVWSFIKMCSPYQGFISRLALIGHHADFEVC